MFHHGRLEREVHLEGFACGFEIAEDIEALFVPGEAPGKEGGEDDDQEAIGEVGYRGISWLQASLELSEDHDNGEGAKGDSASQPVCFVGILDEVDDLCQGTAMSSTTRIMFDERTHSSFRYKLIDKNDNTNSTDKAAQERPAEDTIQEAKSEETCKQNNGSGDSSHHSGDLSVTRKIVVSVFSGTDVLAHDLSSKERSSGFGTNNQLGYSTKNGVDEWIEDECVETINGW